MKNYTDITDEICSLFASRELMIIDFPLHLKLHLAEIEELISRR